MTELEPRGEGVVGDPLCVIRQFWTLDGRLLAEVDPRKNEGYAHPTIPSEPRP